MKLGLMFSNLSQNINKALAFCNGIGLDGLQIGVSYGKFNVLSGNKEAKYVKLERLLQKYKLEISAFCGELGGKGLMERDKNHAQIAKLKTMIDFAVSVNVRIISTHIGVVPSDKNDKTYAVIRDALLEVGAYAKSNGVTIAIETGPEKAVVLKGLLDSLDGGIGINLDPANLVMVACDDPVQAVYTLKDYIVHTHAKDGKNLQAVDTRFTYGFVNPYDSEGLTKPTATAIYEETCLGEGAVVWDNYLKALRDIGYEGYLTIEREYGKNTMEDIAKGAELLRQKNNMKSKVTLAVVGCGSIANGAHLPVLKNLDSVRLKYVVDIVKERADKAKSRYGAEKALTDYKEILNDKELDGVILCTHTKDRTAITVDFLKSGVNVFSEKPVAVCYSEAQKMNVAAKESGKVVNIGVCMRFNTAVNRIKAYIDSGKLGNLYHVVCNFRAHRMIPGIGGEFTSKETAGGGVLIDWGIHYLDLILYCLGSPKFTSVSADSYCVLGKDINAYKSNFKKLGEKSDGIYDVDDFIAGHIKTEKDLSITFNGAWAQNINKNETYIDFLGDKGGIHYDYCGNFTFYSRDLKEEKPKISHNNMYEAELLSFISDIKCGHKGSRNNIAKIMESARLLEEIYKSAKKK